MREIFGLAVGGPETAEAPVRPGQRARTGVRCYPERQVAAPSGQAKAEPPPQEQMIVMHGKEKKLVIFGGGDAQ